MKKILMPRMVDQWANNAQNLNAKSILRYLLEQDVEITTCYHSCPEFNEAHRFRLIKLWPWRFWRLRLFLAYLKKYDIIFYPGVDVADYWGIRFTKLFFGETSIIATLEGLVGDEIREIEYSNLAGHPVYCQKVIRKVLNRVDYVLNAADWVIAISPFLAKMGRSRYKSKFLVLQLGVDSNVFFPPGLPDARDKIVVAAGHVASHKRPEMFLKLARQHPDYVFRWYGGGTNLEEMRAGASSLGNVEFVGEVSTRELGKSFRTASLFVMPSRSEGVPKVTQEAAACGLPIVLFGYYQAPSVQHQKNGLVVWSDEEFFSAVDQLLHNPTLMRRMGSESARMHETLGWDHQGEKWVDFLLTQ